MIVLEFIARKGNNFSQNPQITRHNLWFRDNKSL